MQNNIIADHTCECLDAAVEIHPITLLHGDCLTQISRLKNRSIRAVITSPPYAQQRRSHYPGFDEEEYPSTMVALFNAIEPKLTTDGSILVNIRSHVKDGAVSDYVLRTRLALRKAGFIENEELIWYKPEAAPQGSIYRPRRSWENILWFSTCKNPFVNLTAAGRLSGAIGFGRTKKATELYADLYRGGTARRQSGIARVTDVFIAGVGDNAKGVKHPAPFPPLLVEQLLQTFTEKDDGVLDPFAGSGTTLFVSRFMKRRPFGIEIQHEYIDLIHSREAKIDWNREVTLNDVERRARFIEVLKLDKFTAAGLRDVLNKSFDEKGRQRWKILDS